MKRIKQMVVRCLPMVNTIGRSSILLLVVLAVEVSCGDDEVRQAPRFKRPNIVVVLVDALRRDHLGVYGYNHATSPNLDLLADDSVVFERAFSHGSHTIVSTASLLTGRVLSQILFVDPPRPDDPSSIRIKKGKKLKILVPQGPTLLEVLSRAGYRSVAVLTNPHHHEDSGFPNLFDEPIILIGSADSNPDLPYHDARAVVGEFSNWLNGYSDTEQPFFAYLHFMDTHNPYSAPQPYRQRFVKTKGVDRFVNGVPSEKSRPSAQDLEFMRQNYDAEIAYFDDMFSALVEVTRESASRATVFVVTADHGEEFMDHGGLGHGQTLHKEQVSVPLIFIGTGKEPARDKRLARHIDIAPTLAALAQIEPDPGWEGRNLFNPVELDDDVSREQVSVAYSHHGIWSLTTQDWHFSINRRSDGIWLSNNLEDGTGADNLAPLREDVVNEMLSRIEPYWQSWRDLQAQSKELTRFYTVGMGGENHDEILENLRQLGYVE